MGHLKEGYIKTHWEKAWVIAFTLTLFSLGCASKSTSHKQLSKADRARLYIEIANGEILQGNPTVALQNLVKAEAEDPTLPELYHSKSLAFYAKHDLNRAIQYARQAVKIKPDYSDANNTLGRLLLEIGDYNGAEQPLQAAASDPLYREAYKAWTNLGILKYRQGQYVASEAYLDRAIQDAPLQSCIAYYYRGHIRLRSTHINDAIEDYKQATFKFCANFAQAQLALGLAYQEQKQYQLARKTYLEIQKRYPNTKIAEQALDQLKYLP